MHTLELTNSKQDIQTAGKLLKDGELVAIPTETVYGLAADALNGEAVANIFKAKGRPMDNPLIVHIADLSQVDDLVAFVPPVLEDLAKAFWPGPLTVIMEKSDLIPDEVSAGLDTVAIRMPSHPDARAIIKAAGTPLAAPSANTSGMPSPTTAAHVMHDMDGKIAAVVDGGACEVGVESTVLTLCTRVPRILRPGRVTPEDLFDVLGEVDVDDAVLGQLAEGAVAASPGMKYKHYSPNAEVYIVDGTKERQGRGAGRRRGCRCRPRLRRRRRPCPLRHSALRRRRRPPRPGRAPLRRPAQSGRTGRLGHLRPLPLGGRRRPRGHEPPPPRRGIPHHSSRLKEERSL